MVFVKGATTKCYWSGCGGCWPKKKQNIYLNSCSKNCNVKVGICLTIILTLYNLFVAVFQNSKKLLINAYAGKFLALQKKKKQKYLGARSNNLTLWWWRGAKFAYDIVRGEQMNFLRILLVVVQCFCSIKYLAHNQLSGMA